MEKNQFLTVLCLKLIERDIDEQVAARHVEQLGRTLTEDDEAEITSFSDTEDINDIADSISVLLKKRSQRAQKPQPAQTEIQPKPVPKPTEAAVSPEAAEQLPIPELAVPSVEDVSGPEQHEEEIYQPPMHQTASIKRPRQMHDEEQDIPIVQKRPGSTIEMPRSDYQTMANTMIPSVNMDAESKKYYPTGEIDYKQAEKTGTGTGKTVFWVVFILTLPITLLLALVGIGIFAAVLGSLAVCVIALIAMTIACVAGGTALALVGIIYGITQLFSAVPIGLYEIGIGLMIGGAVMFVSILMYNIAVRLLPWLMRLVSKLFGKSIVAVRGAILHAKGECYKL